MNTVYTAVLNALHQLKQILVTDSTVTRRVVSAHIDTVNNEITLKLDNNSSMWIYPDFEEQFAVEVGCLETEEALYIAPRWWVDM